jgi:anthranilate synthase/aminodeoxychorismate synthase-like glutamine amidotransferase
MWVLIDNYDSFTWILYHYLLQTGHPCTVYRNDEITIPQLADLNPERLILSPGPEVPARAGITMQAIDYFHKRIPILGICLGHQALGEYFGARLTHAPSPMHGKTSQITHTSHPVFAGIPNPFTAMRYHSLAVTDFTATPLESIAQTADGTIMALAHKEHPCIGLQFHPESIGTDWGAQILHNWAK